MIARVYLPWESISVEWSLAQIQSAEAHGCAIDPYVWAYRSVEPEETIQQAVASALYCGLDLAARGTLWIDCETYNPTGNAVEDPGPDAPWLRAAFAEADRLGIRAGLYTARWWWNSTAISAEFTPRPLWAAEYNGIADLDSVTLFGGWARDRLIGHQYAADRIDLSVFRADVLS